jgi:hypothetical protein
MQRRALHCVRVTAHSARDCRAQLDRVAPTRHLTVCVIANAPAEVRDGPRARRLLAALSAADGTAPSDGDGSGGRTSAVGNSSANSSNGTDTDNRRAVIALFSGAPMRGALDFRFLDWKQTAQLNGLANILICASPFTFITTRQPHPCAIPSCRGTLNSIAPHPP